MEWNWSIAVIVGVVYFVGAFHGGWLVWRQCRNVRLDKRIDPEHNKLCEREQRRIEQFRRLGWERRR